MFMEKPSYEELEQQVKELEKAGAAYKQTEHVITFLAQCGIAQNSGFFQAMAQYLAEQLDMDYACISRLAEDQLTAQPVACYLDGTFQENVSYSLSGSPCNQVVEKAVFCIPENLRKVFPHHEVFQSMGAESYTGVALFNHKSQPIGLITLAGRRPLLNPQPIESVLKLAAIRTTCELEHTQYEEESKTARLFIETTLNSLTDSLYVIRTADFTVLWANKAFIEILGLDAKSVIGKHCYELKHHRSTPCAHPNDPCPLLETLKTGQPSTMEHIHFDSAGGKRFFEVSAFPVRNSRGEIKRIVHVDRDVTERKQFEAELLNHNEILEKSISERTAELAMRNDHLEEANTALHVLLQKRQKDKRKVEELIVSNIKNLVYPYLEKMQNDSLNSKQYQLLSIIKTHLNELLSPLLKNLRQFDLTPKEVQVAAMVKDGKTTKEIAEVLGVETCSIDAHRNNIRKKLGLSRKMNLQSKLQSFS